MKRKTESFFRIGRERKEEKTLSASEEVLFVIGMFMIAAMLILPMRQWIPARETRADGTAGEAVYVFNPEERETLVPPEKPASLTEESVFEAIGEFFARLILDDLA